MVFLRYILLYFIITVPCSVFSQVGISVQNVSEMQFGNLPHSQPDDLVSQYNQLNTRLLYGNMYFGLRTEYFNSSYSQPAFNNVEVSRKYFTYQGNNFELTAGNFFGILGRGLTFRSFELTGVINEDFIYRRRYALTRDTEGLFLKGAYDRFEYKIIYGRPLMEDYPPGNSTLDPRYEVVAGGEFKINLPDNSYFGGTYVNMNSAEKHIASGFLHTDLQALFSRINRDMPYIDVYAEFAMAEQSFDQVISFEGAESRAAYLQSNIIAGDLGVSLEYKDYKNFAFRINDPPSLIKEHTSVLLNRSTHVLRASGERGFQIEVFYSLPGDILLLSNFSRAIVTTFQGDNKFYEYYSEVNFPVGNDISAKAFIDYAQDIVQQEDDRITGGLTGDIQLSQDRSIYAAAEWQQLFRNYSIENPRFINMYGSIALNDVRGYTIGFSFERSDDFFETDDPGTPEHETDAKYWFGVIAGLQLNSKFDIQAFAGKRRGGPACLAGTCYEVLPFNGMELRVTSRF